MMMVNMECGRRLQVLLILTVMVVTACMQNSLAARAEARDEIEKRLIYDLFERNGYNPLIRPVRNLNDSLNIRFNLALSQVINLDEVNQVMKTNVWLQVYWNDFQLTWDPAQYGNIYSLKITPEKVWVPDFVLFNNADGNFEVTYKSNCVLSHDSLVYWIPPAIFHSSCSVDVKYFPFDQQICEMKFGSWTYKGTALTYSFYLNRDKLDLTDYLKSGSWDIIDGPGRISTYKDAVTGEAKEQIIFQFVLRRKTLFYTVNLIIPCVLISFVSMCVFALPSGAGEKVQLCISVLLALIVFMLLVSDILPPSLTIPLIARYLLFTFMMNLIAIFSTVVITNRNFNAPTTHEMPYWVRVVFLRELPRFLFMKRPDHDKRWQKRPSAPTSMPSTPKSLRSNFQAPSDIYELSEVNVRASQQSSSDNASENVQQSPDIESSRLNYPTTSNLASNIGNTKVHYSTPDHLGSTSGKTQRRHPASGPQMAFTQRHFSGAECQASSSGNTRSSHPMGATQNPDLQQIPKLQMTPELRQATSSVMFIYEHLKKEKDFDMVLEDWKYVARVLDRLLLLIFLVVTFSGTAGILLNVPHILEFVDQDKIIKDLVEYIRKAENSAP